MGNASSSAGEAEAYKYIKWIPGVGTVYSAIRATVKEAQGEHQQAIDSLWGIGGIPGAIVTTVSDATAFEVHDKSYNNWRGNANAYKTIEADWLDELSPHPLFYPREYDYIITGSGVSDNEIQDAWNLNGEQMKVISGATSNVPVSCAGIKQVSSSDVFTSNAMLTGYIVAFNPTSHAVWVILTTYEFKTFNLLQWSQLDGTQHEHVRTLMQGYQEIAHKENMETFKSFLRY